MPRPDPPTYVKVRETPGWQWLQIRHLPSGQLLDGVLEADSAQGWIVRDTGRINEAGLRVMERIGGCRIRIEWKAGAPQGAGQVPALWEGPHSL